MTPSQNPGQGAVAVPSGIYGAVSHFKALTTLQHRADFLKAASARRHGAGSFMLQARFRADDHPPRVGYTASKKIGNAVARNRAKRRLRAAVHEALRPLAQAGWDYVLVARPQATIARPFADLVADLRQALRAVHPA
ncbi:MAG: ribonuclease P protein component [Candidatus Saccharibacteria bacterium]|nr:ribonuclease P protein component [Pseudorhodobacter sp.]